MRDDLKLAAYAVALGFTLGIQGCSGPRAFKASRFDPNGTPHDGLTFTRGPVEVWRTARGWRVGVIVDDAFTPPTEADFHKNLKAALDDARERSLAAAPWPPAAPGRLFIATLETRHFTFEGVDTVTNLATSALRKALASHAAEYGLEPDWANADDATMREFTAGTGYRDGVEI